MRGLQFYFQRNEKKRPGAYREGVMQRDVVLQRRQLDGGGAHERVAAEPAAATEQRVSAAAAPAHASLTHTPAPARARQARQS